MSELKYWEYGGGAEKLMQMLAVQDDFMEDMTFVQSFSNNGLEQDDQGRGPCSKSMGCDGRHKAGSVGAEPHHCALYCVPVRTICGLWVLSISDVEREQLLGCDLN